MTLHGDLIIRDARPSDFAAWLLLWDGYNAFYGRSGSTALSSEITACRKNRFFDPGERNAIMVAPTCYLQDLFTAPDARGYGVGERLIQAVYARAERDGAGRVYWHTHETNAVARRLYDRVGGDSGFIVYRKP